MIFRVLLWYNVENCGIRYIVSLEIEKVKHPLCPEHLLNLIASEVVF